MNKLSRIVYAPSTLTNEVIYAQWQYLLYEKQKLPDTPYIDLQITAYENEMTKRGGNLFDFAQMELKKLT